MRSSIPCPPWTRRAWLRSAAAVLAAPFLSPRASRAVPQDEEEAEITAIRQRAEAAGLGDFEVGRTEHYLGVGNASASFRAEVLPACEGLAADYLKHFDAKKLPAERPPGRMTLVVLASPEDFGRYLGIAAPGEVRGVYDLDSNRLVFCDNRSNGGPLAARANSIALFHEATHQLTFNTGLLDRDGDVPLCVSEGLAMYGEVRRPDGRIKVGAVNRERLAVLADLASRGGSLVPLARLFVEDELLQPPDPGVHVALSQSWLLVKMFLNDRAACKRFGEYLEAIGPRRSSEDRLADVEAHLGNLEDLDRGLKRLTNRYLR